MTGSWIDRFPRLASLDGPHRDGLLAASRVRLVPAGTVIFSPGKSADYLLLLLAGRVRVQQVSPGGREIVLYRIAGGESCVLTTTCLLAHEDYTAEGIAETDAEAVMIPRRTVDGLLARSEPFRQFVFAAFSVRISDLFLVIQDIAFAHIDIRLAQRLLLLAEAGVVTATHQQLATELGTAREVISRQLQEFQRRGMVENRRGEIRITDPRAMEAYGGHD